MKKIFNNRFFAMLLALAVAFGSCTKDGLTDGDKFMLFYPDVTDIGPSTNMTLKPTYHGAKPHDFKVYNVKFNGEVFQTECFTVEADNGRLNITGTDGLAVGVYSISISCKSGGQSYEFPDIIKVNMMRPVPEGIKVEPSEIVLMLTQVNNVNSEEVFPTAQITTEGDHVSIKNYRIANVTRDGVKMTDWTGFFTIDEATGLIEIEKNGTFVAGKYVFDLRLVTSAAGASSEEGLFANAFAVDIVSPPVSLAYEPEIKRVEEGAAFVSAAPAYVASGKDLVFELKAVYPETAPVTIDPVTGVLSLAAENGLQPGDQIQISIRVTNAYGTKDFDQVTGIEIVDFIQPISKLSYNDSTVWHGTGYSLKPVEVDGDDVKFSLVDLPEALSELTIDENTGVISIVKGNKVEKGDYTVTVKVVNDKGEMTDDIALKVVDNPYFFTKVSWGNNLGLTPSADYASQHRVSVTDAVTIPVVKADSDITEQGWENISFEVVGGRLRGTSDKSYVYASVDPVTGSVKTDPTKVHHSTKPENDILYKTAYVLIVKVTVGAGTPGETVRKVPMFLDFNAPRKRSDMPEAPVYIVKFTPFVFQCNPKTGGVFPAPAILNEDGTPISDETFASMAMTYRRNANYWNIAGPDTHVDGAPDAAGDNTFLHTMWAKSYQSQGLSPAYSNVIPMYSFPANDKQAAQRFGYFESDMTLRILPEKWVDDEGNYANGVFSAQVTLSHADGSTYLGADKYPTQAKSGSPYQMFPVYIWFDTEF